MFAGYEPLVAAIGGLLVGAIVMGWVLSKTDDVDVRGTFDKLFSLLQALLLIRATGAAKSSASKRDDKKKDE